MDKYISVVGGNPLFGSVHISGSKNAALPLLISTILNENTCELNNVPLLEDISVLTLLLKSLGATVEIKGNDIKVTSANLTKSEARYGLVKALRASFLILGPLIARLGEARVSLPGGDTIGSRPVDIHLDGLSAMGVEWKIEHGVVIAKAPNGLKPCEISLSFPSVGATEHLMMTAALIPGTTVIENAAREPEITELASFLSKMGATIEGAGSSTLVIHGQYKLSSAKQSVSGDRIEAATYLCAAAITGGNIKVNGISPNSLHSTLKLLERTGCEISTEELAVKIESPKRLKPISFFTGPFPGVATDIQPLIMAILVIASGKSSVTETVFDKRFAHVGEYRRFGAEILLDGNQAIIEGKDKVTAAPVEGTDIRAASGLVILALAAKGRSSIGQIFHIERGYERFVEKLRNLGADIDVVLSTENRDIVVGC